MKNLSILVSALHDSTDLLRQLNQNLAAVTGLLADDPDEVGNAVHEPQRGRRRRARASSPTTARPSAPRSDKLASITTSARPTTSTRSSRRCTSLRPRSQNFINIYEPAQGALTGALAINNFANPIAFICGAMQAASRLGAEQSAKLCVQYLAPIIKNRQYNFPPLGENLFVGAQARPNEVTYSEDWMRPDYVPPAARAGPAPTPPLACADPPDAPLAAEAPRTSPPPAPSTSCHEPDAPGCPA